MIHCKNSIPSLVVCFSLFGISACADQPADKLAAAPSVHTVLNGLAVDIDSKSGSILKLSFPGA